MPFESENQRKAMFAAAAGNSNIGIPKEVAKEFISHSESSAVSAIDESKEKEIKTEYDVVQLMRDGVLGSPYIYHNVAFFDIRITGTGLAYRNQHQEYVMRDSDIFLSEDFVKRCNGLTVTIGHPDGKIMDSKEFSDRAVGSIVLPYIKGEEVWGIAKIYDEAAINSMLNGEITSTSPGVINGSDDVFIDFNLKGDYKKDPLLIEGEPALLDHIALVPNGVWDKGGEPAGISLSNVKEQEVMSENVASDGAQDKLQAMLDALQGVVTKIDSVSQRVDSVTSRLDSMENNEPAPLLAKSADAEEKEEEKEEKKEVKADAEEKEEKKDMDEEEDKKADEDESMYSDVQAKADSVYSAFGLKASRPLSGESLIKYRTRLLKGLQAYSDEFKGIDLAKEITPTLLGFVEKKIYADALAASSATLNNMKGSHARVVPDSAGRQIQKFYGDSSWMDAFMEPSRKIIRLNSTASNFKG